MKIISRNIRITKNSLWWTNILNINMKCENLLKFDFVCKKLKIVENILRKFTFENKYKY